MMRKGTFFKIMSFMAPGSGVQVQVQGCYGRSLIMYNLIHSHSSYHSIQHNFNSVCKDYVLKKKCLFCRFVINFGFLLFYFKIFGTLLCTDAILFKSHSIAYH